MKQQVFLSLDFLLECVNLRLVRIWLYFDCLLEHSLLFQQRDCCIFKKKFSF